MIRSLFLAVLGLCSIGVAACARSTTISPDPTADPGARLRILAANEPEPRSLAVDRTHLYWTVHREGFGAEVRRMLRSGGAVTTLARGVTGPSAIAVRGPEVWVASLGGASAIENTDPNVHVLKGALGVATTAGEVFFGDATAGEVRRAFPTKSSLTRTSRLPFMLATDERHVYWTELAGGITRVERTGTPTPLVITDHRVGRIALDAGNVVWVDVDTGTISRRPKIGGPVTVIAEGQHGAAGLAVDGGRVVWTHPASGTIRSASVAGGPWTVIAEEQLDPAEIVADDGSIYWITHEGTIVGLEKRDWYGGTPEALARRATRPLDRAGHPR
ncbi:MAG: hypothetical protein HYV09_15840 [Deltaproteobacteria bacterium]|nr:hypothetical protein [Deltaproteobacteria bacterium]